MLDRVLLTNDDGIDAPGLAVLVDIASEIARDVWVVAPMFDQSGVSHAISLHHPLRIVAEGERRYGVNGTPGDCVVMGVCHLMRDAPPELILSGVNRGANLGMETVFSGTVGGAMTGMMLGIPSLGLSQAFTDRGRVPWDVSRTLGAGVVRKLLAIGWNADTCLNVNFPDRPVAEVGQPTLCRQGVGLISGMQVDSGTDPRGIDYHWINFRRSAREQGPDSDADAVAAGRIAVTPIRYDRTDEPAFAALAAHLPRLGYAAATSD